MTDAELENRYTYHPPVGDQADRYARIRAKVLETAKLVCALCPDSSERRVALMYLDQVMFNANAAIARHETPPAPPEQPRWKAFRDGVRVKLVGFADTGRVAGPVVATERGPNVAVIWDHGTKAPGGVMCDALEVLPAFRAGDTVRATGDTRYGEVIDPAGVTDPAVVLVRYPDGSVTPVRAALLELHPNNVFMREPPS